ncbi:MAG: GWxTD domain-containing protein [Candidatus Krumholzibacteriia bacterium]
MHRTDRHFPRRLVAVFALVTGVALLPSESAAFSIYARSLVGADRAPSVKVSTSIPHSELVFLRTEGVYQASYRVYIRIISAGGKKLLDTAVENETVVVEDYQQTRSHKRTSNLSRRFQLPPGDYIVECTAQIKDTHLLYSKQAQVTVPNVAEAGVGLGRPRLYAAPIDGSHKGDVLVRSREGSDLRPKESPTFADLHTRPAFEFDVFLQQEFGDSVPCQVTYEVTNRAKSQVLYGRATVKLSGSTDRFVIPVNVDDWEPGPYSFHVKVALADPPRATTSHLSFDLGFTRSMLTRYFDRTLEVLSLIGERDEIEELKNAPEGERGTLWLEFWQRRDPTPGTEENEALIEHFRRLGYVEEHFSMAGPGWSSDRGRIYIEHGEPDEIETRSDPYLQGSYLIWRYYTGNRTFVFYDRFGLGEYRLSQTSAF